MTYQPPRFTATGLGLNNKAPNTPATSRTANCYLRNLGLPSSDKNHLMYLYVSEFSTGWTLAGNVTQTHNSRSFYPHSMTQSAVVLRGVTPNQFEFDRIVEYTNAHHNRAMDVAEVFNQVSGPSIEIVVLPDRVPTGNGEFRTIHNGLHSQGYITRMQAGHKRFVQAPEWELSFQLSNDYLDSPVGLQGILDAYLKKRYIQLFGNVHAFDRPPTGDGFQTTVDPGSAMWDKLIEQHK